MNDREFTDDNTLIFLHIPKTAGVTLNTILETHFSKEESYSTSMSGHHRGGSLDGFQALSDKRKAGLKLIYGHMGFGLHKQVPRNAHYFTMLREPIDRLISHFYYERREPRGPIYYMIHNDGMDFRGYVEHMASVEMDNLQTRMISGNWHKRGFGKCTPEILATAKRNLRDRFLVAGITERFDETYLLLKRHLGWQHVFFTKRNVTKDRPGPKQLSLADRSAAREINEFDLELYDYARELLQQQTREQGLSLSLELGLYRMMRTMRLMFLPTWQEIRKRSVRVAVRRWIRRLQS